MTCGNAEGWLVLGGVEIANEARLRSYLDNGETKYNPNGVPDPNCCLGCSGIRFKGGYCELSAWDPCANGGIGAFEEYERPDGLTNATGDPAPWFDLNDPDSGQFLGVWIYEMDGWDSTTTREVIPQRFGSGFGAERKEGREVNVRAKLFATSCCGMEYGKRWLNRVLSSSQNGQSNVCCTFDATIRTCCDETDIDKGLYNLCDVAVTEGFRVVNDDSDGCSKCDACCDCDIEWTMHVGNPFLFGCEEGCGGGYFQPPVFGCGAIPSIEKGSFTTQVDVGDCAQFFINVTNDSDATLAWEDVIVQDNMLPAWDLQGGTVSTTQGTVLSGQNFPDTNVYVDVGDIAPGVTVTIQYNACLLPSGIQGTQNTALAFSSNNETIVDFETVPFAGGCNCVPTVDFPTGPCEILSPTTYQVSYPPGCTVADYQTPTWFIDGIQQGVGDTFTVFPWSGGAPRDVQVFILGFGNCLNQTLLNETTTCTSTPAATCSCGPWTPALPAANCAITLPTTYTLTVPANCDPSEYGAPQWTVDSVPIGTGLSITIDPGLFTNGNHSVGVTVPGAGTCLGQTLHTESRICSFGTIQSFCNCTVSVNLSEPCAISSTQVYQVQVTGCSPTEWANPQWFIDGVLVNNGTFFVLDPSLYSNGPHAIRLLIDGEGDCLGTVIYDQTFNCTFSGNAQAPARIADDAATEKMCSNIEKWMDRREMNEEDFIVAFAERTDRLEIDLDQMCESGYPEGFVEIAADIFGVKPSSVTGRRS